MKAFTVSCCLHEKYSLKRRKLFTILFFLHNPDFYRPWKKTALENILKTFFPQGCPFCCLLRHEGCHKCSARWNGRCVDRRTAVVYSYTPIKQAITSSNSRPKSYLHREKNIRFGTRITNILQSYKLRGKQLFVSHGRGPILYTKNPRDPTGQDGDWTSNPCCQVLSIELLGLIDFKTETET